MALREHDPEVLRVDQAQLAHAAPRNDVGLRIDCVQQARFARLRPDAR